MKNFCYSTLTVLLLANIAFAEGMLYQLPDDGHWVRYELNGIGSGIDGEVSTITGTLTMSCVGISEVDGKKCRWIEIAEDCKRAGEPYQLVHKLLIPEEYLAKGEEPLKHIVRAWRKHSQHGDNPQAIDLNGKEASSLQTLDYILHGPYKSQNELEAVQVECKLGALKCEGISAFEKTDLGGVTYESSFVIRLHDKAPFGVVTVEGERKVQREGKFLGKMTMSLKLVDCGEEAKSALPDSN